MYAFWDYLLAKGAALGDGIISAAVILIVGLIAIKLVLSVVNRLGSNSRLEPIVVGYIKTCVKVVLYVILGIVVLSRLGVSVVSLVAVLSAAAAAVALALQNSLSNLAAGILIIVNKPFSKGDFIENSSVAGVVDEIHLLNCRLHTNDNKFVVVPNNNLISGVITNYSYADKRRVDTKVNIGYDDDLDKTKQVLLQIAAENPQILSEPEPFVGVAAHNDSSVELDFRVWCKTGDYWNVFYYVEEEVLRRFRKENITIPYPQLDVHIDKEG
jgi:small conductance mechanosensitive channel